MLYLIRATPGQSAHWREALEMALTGAAFGVSTTVWLGPAPLMHLARREDAGVVLAELGDFGVRCVALQDDLLAPLPGVEALDCTALAQLRAAHNALMVL